MSSPLIAMILAVASVAGAVPTLEVRQDYSYIIDPWAKNAPPGQQAVAAAAVSRMMARGDNPQPSNTAEYDGFIPGCDADPSYVIPKTTTYAINQGVKVPKSGNDDECTTGHNGDHCWTEYYLVEQAVEIGNWRLQGTGIDCSTTSTCDSSSAAQGQTCTGVTTTSTTGFDTKVAEVGIQGEVTLKYVGKIQPSFSFGGTVTHSGATAHLTNTCIADTDTNTCHWTDQKCHQLWVADRVMHIWGQAQRVCNGGASKGTQQSTKRDDGKYVRGQADFDFVLPINTVLGCGAMCNDATYNAQLPANGTRAPFPQPQGF